MRYLKGTLDCGLRYAVDVEIRLHGYTYSYWDGSTNDKKSTSGCYFSLGSGVISWLSRNPACVALGIVEDEYMTACLSCSEAI